MDKYKVLIVDDDPNIISAIIRLSKDEKFSVTGAGSAKEALHFLNTGFFDLVITDENMPGMKGSEFILKIRDMYPGIIKMMLTGNASLDLAVNLINQGDIYRFFTKPCNSNDLIINIRHALQFRDLLKKSYKLLQIVRHQSKMISLLQSKDNKLNNDIILEPTSKDINKIKVDSLIEEIEAFNNEFATKD